MVAKCGGNQRECIVVCGRRFFVAGILCRAGRGVFFVKILTVFCKVSLMLLQGVIVIMLLNQLKQPSCWMNEVQALIHPRAPHEGRRKEVAGLRPAVEESPPLFFGGGGEAACRPKRRGKKEVRQKQQQKKSFHSVGTEAELSIWEHDGQDDRQATIYSGGSCGVGSRQAAGAAAVVSGAAAGLLRGCRGQSPRRSFFLSHSPRFLRAHRARHRRRNAAALVSSHLTDRRR